MRTFRLALAQINTIVGDLKGNTKKITSYIQKARKLKADLIAFPELAITGYPPEDLIFKAQFIQENINQLNPIIEAASDITAIVGFVDSKEGIYNAAAVISYGKLAGIYHKIDLPNYGVFDEKRYFIPGNTASVYTINGINIGINICEDIWYKNGPTSLQAADGAKLIVNINGSPFHSGKAIERENMLAARAYDNNIFIAYLNMVGGQDELVFDGGSMIFSPNGSLILKASQFEEEMIVIDLNISSERDQERYNRANNIIKEKKISKNTKIIHISKYHTSTKPILNQVKSKTRSEIGQIYSALVLGTKDYVHKTGFKKILIGMSGGIDSSLVSVIARDALGKDNVLGIAMPSRYSSESSLTDAQALSDNIGIELWTINIDKLFSGYLDTLSIHFQNTVTGIAEENLQARIRGTILMGISNKFGWLVITTGNKSELAVGYSTLYGDMAGGFAIIKDVSKTLVYSLAKYRNSITTNEIIPQNVLDKAPSAELKPNQFDQDSLPPYEILDRILTAYVEKDYSLNDIVKMGYNKNTVKAIIKLVNINEYKRRQSPPGIKITPRNFGRDRRMPIVNLYDPFKKI